MLYPLLQSVLDLQRLRRQSEILVQVIIEIGDEDAFALQINGRAVQRNDDGDNRYRQ